MTRKASPSYNHVCMDAMQDKQESIQGCEWAVNRISYQMGMLRVDWLSGAKSALNLNEIKALPPTKS